MMRDDGRGRGAAGVADRRTSGGLGPPDEEKRAGLKIRHRRITVENRGGA